MKNNDEIEQLFYEKFSDYSVSPSENVWKKILRKLNFSDFFTFKYNEFNIFYLCLVIAKLTFLLMKFQSAIQEEKPAVSVTTKYKNYNYSLFFKDIKNHDKKETGIDDELVCKPDKNIVNKKTVSEKLSDNSKINPETKRKENILNIEKKSILADLKTLSNEADLSEINKIEAIFTADKYSGCLPLKVNFSNKSINAKSFIWDFGNGKNSIEKNPVFIYENSGKYTVTLTVFANGLFQNIKKQITVYENPVAQFVIFDKNNINAEKDIIFVNMSLGAEKYLWDFGNNTISYEKKPLHTYKNKGIYNIKLIAFSKAGCSDSVFKYNINVKKSKYTIKAPTGLIVNSLENGIFNINFGYAVSEYKLLIYNRYGKLIYESNDINSGWNAYYNNKIVPADVYIWQCSGKFIDGKLFSEKGNLTVINSGK